MPENNLVQYLRSKLSSLKDENRLRHLSTASHGADFFSNDYLGLARSEELFNLIHEKEKNSLPRNGATGSRLLSGNTSYTLEVEEKLADIFHATSTLIFGSGYLANLAVLSCLPQRGDTILYDELAHTCIKDGARLSLATRYSFKHNNLEDLKAKLLKAQGRIYIAIESVYSMDGDVCPLQEVVHLSKKHNAIIVLDEAHTTGVMGAGGSGLATSLNLSDEIDIRIYTFGKAMGCHGACVAGSTDLISYLINFARPFIYTTALPPHSVIAIECAFNYLHTHIDLQQTLQAKIDLFNLATNDLRNKKESHSSIQTVLFPGNSNARNAALLLQKKDLDVRPILSPTIPVGSERLRICLHSYNHDDDIVLLASILKDLSENRELN